MPIFCGKMDGMCSPNTKIHLVVNAVLNVLVDANALKNEFVYTFSGSHWNIPV
jgi:hypothetical protein